MRRLLPLVLLAACTPTEFAFSPMVKGVVAKPSNCPVDVVTSPPSRGYQELGTLELYNGSAPKTLDEFKKAVHKQVCEVGGDAAIAIGDGNGTFTKGSVLAYTDTGAAPVKPGAPPEQTNDNELPTKK